MKYAFDTNVIVALLREQDRVLYSRYLDGQPQVTPNIKEFYRVPGLKCEAW